MISALATTASFSVAGIYTLRLTANDGALSDTDDVVITVSPNSGAAPLVSWTLASQTAVVESGIMTVSAQLSATSTQSITVPFSITGSASGSDRTVSASPITIAPGATTGAATITITADTLDEPNETVILTLEAPTNATLGTTQIHTATITDDDATTTVAFSATTSSGSEATTAVTIPVALSAASGQTISVAYTVTGGSATGSGTTTRWPADADFRGGCSHAEHRGHGLQRCAGRSERNDSGHAECADECDAGHRQSTRTRSMMTTRRRRWRSRQPHRTAVKRRRQ